MVTVAIAESADTTMSAAICLHGYYGDGIEAFAAWLRSRELARNGAG